LNRYYQQRGTAFRIEEVAGGFQLYARPQLGPWLRRLYQSPVQTRLSSPALETLAVVAYRQPVLRADVEALRGVQSGEILRQLMERDLVRIVGRSPELGRPFLYGTTKRFLRIFGLRHLDDLPRVASLRPATTSPATNAEKPPDGSGELDTPSNCLEEPDVRITALLEPPLRKLRDASEPSWPHDALSVPFAAKDEEEEDVDEDDDYEDEDDDEEDDLEEDDLEEEEWEEVDDDDEEEDFDDEDEDWEDDDEDDDWDDDEDDDWEEEEEPD
jgi:segregation and condensation protein B